VRVQACGVLPHRFTSSTRSQPGLTFRSLRAMRSPGSSRHSAEDVAPLAVLGDRWRSAGPAVLRLLLALPRGDFAHCAQQWVTGAAYRAGTRDDHRSRTALSAHPEELSAARRRRWPAPGCPVNSIAEPVPAGRCVAVLDSAGWGTWRQFAAKMGFRTVRSPGSREGEPCHRSGAPINRLHHGSVARNCRNGGRRWWRRPPPMRRDQRHRDGRPQASCSRWPC